MKVDSFFKTGRGSLYSPVLLSYDSWLRAKTGELSLTSGELRTVKRRKRFHRKTTNVTRL